MSIIVEMNCETNKITERAMTKEEIAQAKLDVKTDAKQKQDLLDLQTAKESAIKKLAEIAGLTKDELNAIL
jgi:DNA-directed RNA polymerase subunit F